MYAYIRIYRKISYILDLTLISLNNHLAALICQILPFSQHKCPPPRLLISCKINPSSLKRFMSTYWVKSISGHEPLLSSWILFSDLTTFAPCPRLFPLPRLLILQLLSPLLDYSLLLSQYQRDEIKRRKFCHFYLSEKIILTMTKKYLTWVQTRISKFLRSLS